MAKNSGILQTRMDQRGYQFSISEMSVTDSKSGKSRRKKWCHLSSFHVLFLSYGPSILKKVHFWQFCADLSKKYKSINAIYIYASERSH